MHNWRQTEKIGPEGKYLRYPFRLGYSASVDLKLLIIHNELDVSLLAKKIHSLLD